MRILLIEDDKETSSAIWSGLKDRYTIDCAFTGEDALSQAETNVYDVYLLDLSLPDMNGVSVCRQLRKNGQQIPILILTASTNLEDKVLALDAGADDFLSKPFHFEELHARLRALSRRGKFSQRLNILQVGDIKIYLDEGKAYHKDLPLDLRRKEFLLLEHFLRHAGQILSRNALLENVWESKSDPLTNTVDVHIKFLRDKIDKPFGTHYFRTIHGMGYKFDLEGR